MKGIFGMTHPSQSTIFGQLDGLAANASGLQEVADAQAGAMQQLGSILEGLAPNLQGAAGAAMQYHGNNIKTAGMQISPMFADHSHMMSNNAAILSNSDQDHAHIIGAVASNLTV
jgi:hypothetical protein